MNTVKITMMSLLVSFPIFAEDLSLDKILGDHFVPREKWDSLPDYENLEKEGRIESEELKQIASLHHTVRGSMYAKEGRISEKDELQSIEDIQGLHMETWNFADIGYHFMIGQSGKVYQGRGEKYVGAHTGGGNRKNTGLAFLGCYDEKGCVEEGYQVTSVTDEMIESAAKLVAYLSIKYDFEINEDTVIPRSTFDIQKKGTTKFKYSPGNLIQERLAELIERAKNYAVELRIEIVKESELDQDDSGKEENDLQVQTSFR